MSYDAGHRVARGKLQVFLPLAPTYTLSAWRNRIDAPRNRHNSNLDAPILVRSWRELPENPLHVVTLTPDESVGLLQKPTSTHDRHADRLDTSMQSSRQPQQQQEKREEYVMFCDTCQKGFRTQEKYDAHMATHVYCTVPGCRYTCRKDKEWKMEMHVDLLHNRPDAPDLADTAAYLASRRQQYPTHEVIEGKKEELFYKASRGAVLPDERRRWMLQHGITIRKRPRSGESYIVDGKLTEAAAEEDEGEKDGDAPESDSESTTSSSSNDSSTSQKPPQMPPLAATTAVVATSASGEGREKPALKKRIVPKGPNGTLTAQQRVQIVKERYAESTEVPRFYVCNRCGLKGNHWVSDCPTRGDTTFDRHMNWGEARLVKPQEGANCPVVALGAANLEPPASSGSMAHETQPQEDMVREEEKECPPASHTARREPPLFTAEEQTTRNSKSEVAESGCRDAAESGDAVKEVTRVMAPVAAARLAKKSSAAATAAARGRHGGQPAAPTLYDRLTEDQRLNERGLMLQATRFFVARNFFDGSK